jgi:hypothetical protein
VTPQGGSHEHDGRQGEGGKEPGEHAGEQDGSSPSSLGGLQLRAQLQLLQKLLLHPGHKPQRLVSCLMLQSHLLPRNLKELEQQ